MIVLLLVLLLEKEQELDLELLLAGLDELLHGHGSFRTKTISFSSTSTSLISNNKLQRYELWFYLEPTRGFVPLCVSYIWFFYLLHNVRMTNYTDYELHMMGYDVSSLEGRATLRCYRNPGKYAPPKFRAKPIEPRTEDG